jgi:hypothetical protein
MSTGAEPMSCDPLNALGNEYGAEWNVRHPGKYVADHRRLDVTLISDSVPGPSRKATHVHRANQGSTVTSLERTRETLTE